MGHYAAIIRFALWAILVCAAAVQSHFSATADQPENRSQQQHHRPAEGRQQIELMIPGFAANAPYQELRITKPAVAKIESGVESEVGSELGSQAGDAATNSSEATSQAAEGSANIIQEFVEFTGTVFGQLVAVGLILTFCWRVARRIQREEAEGRGNSLANRGAGVLG